MKILITGACGLVGTECVLHFSKNKKNKIYGIDNNARKYFFGDDGDVIKNLNVISKIPNYTHYNNSVIDKDFVFNLFKNERFDVVISAHGQPSHDWAVKDVLLDFNTNCTSVLYLLEATKLYSPEAVFIQCSTNKVYGSNPNLIKLKELETRYEYDDEKYSNGIDESMSIDNTTHSLFGCGKVASDVYAQEYAKYYGLNVAIFRPCCITGNLHSGASLHGFLNYIVKCAIQNIPYNIIGYKGKQVRSNIHSVDLVEVFNEVINNPKKDALYNMGGGKDNSISVLETIDLISKITGKKLNYQYSDTPRIGDHIVYYEDLSKFKSHYPKLNIKYSLEDIIKDIADSLQK